jgi:hypothetical protein
MGKSEVKATLCPNCSYEHVIVPMFKLKKHFLPVKAEPQVNVEFEPDFEV